MPEHKYTEQAIIEKLTNTGMLRTAPNPFSVPIGPNGEEMFGFILPGMYPQQCVYRFDADSQFALGTFYQAAIAARAHVLRKLPRLLTGADFDALMDHQLTENVMAIEQAYNVRFYPDPVWELDRSRKPTAMVRVAESVGQVERVIFTRKKVTQERKVQP